VFLPKQLSETTGYSIPQHLVAELPHPAPQGKSAQHIITLLNLKTEERGYCGLQAIRIYKIYPHPLRDCERRPRHDVALREPTTHINHAYGGERAHHAAKTGLARVNSAGAADGTPLVEAIVNVTNRLNLEEACAGLPSKSGSPFREPIICL